MYILCVLFFVAATRKAPKKTQHSLARLFETSVPKQTIKKKKKTKHVFSPAVARERQPQGLPRLKAKDVSDVSKLSPRAPFVALDNMSNLQSLFKFTITKGPHGKSAAIGFVTRRTLWEKVTRASV